MTAKGACFWFRGTSSSPACCSPCWSAQLEESTAKGALERKHRLCSPRPLERTDASTRHLLLDCQWWVYSQTVILSGQSAINLTFVSRPSCPSSIWMSVEIKARCHRGKMPLFSLSQPLILKRFVSCSVWGCCWEHMNRESAGLKRWYVWYFKDVSGRNVYRINGVFQGVQGLFVLQIYFDCKMPFNHARNSSSEA